MTHAPRTEGRGLRVATFNVRAAIGPGPFPDRWWRRSDPIRLARIADVITDLAADIIGLQEVAVIAVDGTVVDQAAELGRLTGLHHRYAAVRTWVASEAGGVMGAGLFGNALLTRSEPEAAVTLALPAAASDALIEAEGLESPWAGIAYAAAPSTVREPRCALLATVGGVRVATAHLSHVGSGERLLQARALAETDADVVLGDLNSPLDQPAMAPFAAWTDAFAATGVPLGDDRRRSTDDGWPIDQVLLRPGAPWAVRGCEVVRAAGEASDHYPVIADLVAR